MVINKLKNNANKKSLETITSDIVDNNRFIYLTGEIDEDKAKDVIEKLLELQESNPIEEITLIINSGGGEIYSMYAIADIMEIIHPKIRTVCASVAYSAAAYIFLCGNKRYMTKHSSLLIHQVSGGMWGTTKDVNVEIDNMNYLQEQMVKEISEKSNLSVEDVDAMIDRDCYIRPDTAIKYGMCDGIIERLM